MQEAHARNKGTSSAPDGAGIARHLHQEGTMDLSHITANLVDVMLASVDTVCDLSLKLVLYSAYIAYLRVPLTEGAFHD